MVNRVELALLFFFTVLISGCESGSHYASSVTDSSNSGNDIARCEKELQALKKINSVKYTELEVKFEQVMHGAASYAAVRGIVDPATQNTVDALYHFRSAKVCTEIRARMLESLVSQSGVNP